MALLLARLAIALPPDKGGLLPAQLLPAQTKGRRHGSQEKQLDAEDGPCPGHPNIQRTSPNCPDTNKAAPVDELCPGHPNVKRESPSCELHSPSPALFIEPFHGLGNRLRALQSAAEVAVATGRQLHVVWRRDEHIDATFWQLFSQDPFNSTEHLSVARVTTLVGNETMEHAAESFGGCTLVYDMMVNGEKDRPTISRADLMGGQNLCVRSAYRLTASVPRLKRLVWEPSAPTRAIIDYYTRDALLCPTRSGITIGACPTLPQPHLHPKQHLPASTAPLPSCPVSTVPPASRAGMHIRQEANLTKDVPGMSTSDPVYGAIMAGNDSDAGGDYRRSCEWPVHLRALDAVLQKEAASVDLGGTVLTKAEAKCTPPKCTAGKQCDVRLPLVLVASDTPEVLDYISREVRPLLLSGLPCTAHVHSSHVPLTFASSALL